MKTYEGMFLVDPAQASTKWDESVEHIKGLITKHGGKIINITKWAERKLCYTIKQQRRGTYVLSYFEAPPDAISKLNADFNLSEIVLRAMILVKTEKEMNNILNPKPASRTADREPVRTKKEVGNA
jgi:ribosomal protein S6